MSTSGNADAAGEARALVAGAASAALATIDRQSGSPYVSLVNVATTVDKMPILLLSDLARHTLNIAGDPRGSLLFAADAGTADPLTLGRVTLMGQLIRAPDNVARSSFLARHPAASQYADFGDFSFYRFVIAGAHFIGGFGRIVNLSGKDLLQL